MKSNFLMVSVQAPIFIDKIFVKVYYEIYLDYLLTSMKRIVHYFNNLKIFLIGMVVAVHAALAYQLGGKGWPVADPVNTNGFLPFLTWQATYFMGLFFLISGYFLPDSCKKGNAWPIFTKKLIRLGIPTLLTVFVLLPPTLYLTLPLIGRQDEIPSFWSFYADGFLSKAYFTFGHTWFIVQLLLYSTIYIFLRPALERFFKTKLKITHTTILFYTLFLFGTTWIVNLSYPQDAWRLYHLFEPYHLPQYISLFFLGIFAKKNQLLDALENRVGYVWLAIGILGVLYMSMHQCTGMLYDSPTFNALWSSFMCSAWCVGLLTLFRGHVNGCSPLQEWLARNTYGVYLLHVSVIVFLHYILFPYAWNAWVKFSIVFVIGYVLSNGICGLLRMTPYLRKII
ncbi:MAG: acyltransferase [Verrucomicrobia bacterium]|nr:acyltransferase [Verrucomicrobiota bacterium]